MVNVKNVGVLRKDLFNVQLSDVLTGALSFKVLAPQKAQVKGEQNA